MTRRTKRLVEPRHRLGGGGVVGTDHYPIWLEEVVHGVALAEELRVAHHRDSWLALGEHRLETVGGADRDRRLEDDDGVRARSRPLN